MIPVVLDTNIILSSLPQPLGPPAKVFHLARRGFVRLCVSGAYTPSMKRCSDVPGFGGLCNDPDDDIFLECAQAARASWPVAGNVRNLPSLWLGTEIVTPSEFLERLTGEAERV